jgi:pimeloyl-ACP methyl ester carboxylesterase
MNGLSHLRWFTDPVMKIAAPVVWRTVTQVTRYMSDEAIRTQAQQRVLDLIDDDTRLVIGHSLGSVVAYETLHHSTRPAALITLGSPLGLQNVIYREGRLQVWPAHVPAKVTSWYNFAAKDDLVAARLDIAPYFPPAPGSTVTPISHIVDTGSKPHDIIHYLTQPSCGQAVTYALT